MEFITRLTAIIFVTISPFIMVAVHGSEYSLSAYWTTPFQPMFILSNAITSYFFFSTPSWKLPGIFLMLLTGFSVAQYPIIHDVLAVSFFISCAIVLYKSHHFNYYLYIYIAMVFIIPFTMLWGEIFGIIILCAYHARLLFYKRMLDNRRNKIK